MLKFFTQNQTYCNFYTGENVFFFFAYSQLIEISSLTTTACRNCDNALSLDYYEMLMLKKDVETEMMDVLELLCEITPVAKPDLGCQFPNHEKLLGNIRSCAKLVLRKYHGMADFISPVN